MKKVLALVMALCMVFALCAVSASADEPVTLTYAEVNPLDGTIVGEMAKAFKAKVEELSGGSVLADGVPETVLTEELLSALYGVGVAVRSVRVEDIEERVSIPFERKEGAR